MKYSDKYVVDATEKKYGVEYKCSKQINNIMTLNSDFDESILYTKTKVTDFETMYQLPFQMNNNANSNWEYPSTKTIKDTTLYVAKVRDDLEEVKEKHGVVFTNYDGYSDRFFFGYNIDRNSTDGNGGGNRFLLDFKIKNIIFKVELSGYKKADVEDWLNKTSDKTISPTNIPFDEIYENPDDYYIDNCKIACLGLYNADENKYSTYNGYRVWTTINSKKVSTGITPATYFSYNIPLNSKGYNFNLKNRAFTGGTNFYKLAKLDKMIDYIDFRDVVLEPQSDFIGEEPNKLYYGRNEILKETDKYVIFGCHEASTTGGNNINGYNVYVKIAIKPKAILTFLATLGIYFVGSDTSLATYISNYNPDTLINAVGSYTKTNGTTGDAYVYLGEMDSSGFTTGKLLRSEELKNYNGYNKDGNSKNENFNPSISTSDDDIADMPLGYDILDNGMIKYYQITVGDLVKVATVISNMSYANTIKTVWDTLNDTKETDKLDTILNTLRTWGVSADNVMPSIVSLKSFGISTSNFLAAGGTKSESIVLNGVDCETNSVRIIASSMAYHIGDYTINGKYGDAFNPHFLDYKPYTQMEIYIPYCGTVELPSKCMYNTINVYLLGDIFSGSCVGVVKCKGAIVATKAGMIGVDTPLTSNGNGMKSNALMTGVMNSIGIGAQTILSGATGNMGGIISGATAGMANISQQIQAGNENYTRMIGNVSDKCAWALPHQSTIKIVHPIPKYGDNYDRTYGRPVCKSRTLNSGDGFTIIDNPIINGNMTLAEKTEIENYLRSGVIL